MKTKTLLVFIALLSVANYCFSQNWEKLSRNIKKHQTHLIDKDRDLDRFYMEQYYKYRQTECLQNLEINLLNDTIYFLEMYDDGSTLVFLSSVWNKNKRISYQYNFDKFIFCNESRLFGSYMTKIVSEWNIPEIRKEEEENSGMIPTNYIYATRIIFKNKKYKVDCIKFKDFFKLDRDGLDIWE